MFDKIKYQLNRALSVRLEEEKSAIKVGLTPVSAITINQPPNYLATTLETLSKPHTFSELKLKIKSKYPELKDDKFQDTFEDLIKLKVVRESFQEERYHRHQLYFDLFDVSPKDYQETLAGKTVGLIGAGGVGSTCALLLATAGVGKILMLDHDYLEETNLTRTILFEESDIAQPKVSVAKKRLEARNHNIQVIPVEVKCTDAKSLEKSLDSCDLLILSADSPAYQIQEWTNEASFSLGIPYINAGYIETFGVVGPFVIPGLTPCYKCHKTNNRNFQELNQKLQAPSYGPLNALVSSIAVNEVIRFLLELDIATLGKRLLIDSRNYQINTTQFEIDSSCECQVH